MGVVGSSGGGGTCMRRRRGGRGCVGEGSECVVGVLLVCRCAVGVVAAWWWRGVGVVGVGVMTRARYLCVRACVCVNQPPAPAGAAAPPSLPLWPSQPVRCGCGANVSYAPRRGAACGMSRAVPRVAAGRWNYLPQLPLLRRCHFHLGPSQPVLNDETVARRAVRSVQLAPGLADGALRVFADPPDLRREHTSLSSNILWRNSQ